MRAVQKRVRSQVYFIAAFLVMYCAYQQRVSRLANLRLVLVLLVFRM